MKSIKYVLIVCSFILIVSSSFAQGAVSSIDGWNISHFQYPKDVYDRCGDCGVHTYTFTNLQGTIIEEIKLESYLDDENLHLNSMYRGTIEISVKCKGDNNQNFFNAIRERGFPISDDHHMGASLDAWLSIRISPILGEYSIRVIPQKAWTLIQFLELLSDIEPSFGCLIQREIEDLISSLVVNSSAVVDEQAECLTGGWEVLGNINQQPDPLTCHSLLYSTVWYNTYAKHIFMFVIAKFSRDKNLHLFLEFIDNDAKKEFEKKIHEMEIFSCSEIFPQGLDLTVNFVANRRAQLAAFNVMLNSVMQQIEPTLTDAINFEPEYFDAYNFKQGSDDEYRYHQHMDDDQCRSWRALAQSIR